MRSRLPEIDKNSLLGLLAILLWSSTVALARSISEQIGPLTAGASVFLTGGLVLAVGLSFEKGSVSRLRSLPRAYLFGCGSLFLAYIAALFLALGLAAGRQQAIEVGLVNYLWPALTILFSLVILSKRASFGLVPGTLLALVGLVLVLTQDGSMSGQSLSANVARNPAAYALGLAAAVSWALYSNLTRRWAAPDGGSGVPLFAIATGLVLLFARLLFPEDGVWSVRVVLEIAFLGSATALAYVFWDVAMRRGDIVLVVSCSYLTPFLATLVACAYLWVAPGLKLWLGCLFLIGGSFLSWRSVDG
jgi:drug/metabolite transporter (DMT)-like permease